MFALAHAVLPDGFKYLLQQLKLVGNEWIHILELICILITGPCWFCLEQNQIREFAAVGVIKSTKRCNSSILLFKNSLFDNLIGIGTGEEQACIETALNFGEVLLLILGAVNHSLQLLLRGNNNPCLPTAVFAQIFNAGLQVQHKLGVVTDKLSDLVHKENNTGFVCLAVFADDFGKVLRGVGEAPRLVFHKCLCTFLCHAAYGNKCLYNGITVQKCLGAGLYPVAIGYFLEFSNELLQLAFFIKRALHIRYPRAGTAVSYGFVKCPEHNIHDGLRLSLRV